MAHSSWGPGWPNCQPGRINSGFSVSGTRFPGGMRVELVDLTSMLVQETKNRGYRFGNSGDPSYGCWGYSCRAISGSSSPSNHSWGLAVDINAPSNPYTSPLVTDMPGWMPDLWNQYGFRWGGDYSGSKDAMHYEFMESVQAASEHTARARSAGLGGGSAVPPTNEDEMTEDDFKRIQAMIPTADQVAAAVWSRVLNTFRPVAVPGQDDRAGDLLAGLDQRAQSLPTDDSVAGAVWSKGLDSYVGRTGAEARAGNVLAFIDVNTANG